MLDGVTVTGGHTSLSAQSPYGAGILCRFADVVVRDCLIVGNQTHDGFVDAFVSSDPGGDGAGVYCDGGANEFINCVIMANRTGDGGAGAVPDAVPFSGTRGGNGAGLYASSEATVIMTNCSVMANVTGRGGDGGLFGVPPACSSAGDGGDGAGVYLGSGTAGTFRNCLIADNIAGDGGEGFLSCFSGDGGSAGGVYMSTPNTSFTNCTIANNRAGDHGPGPVPGNGGLGGGLLISGTGFDLRLQSCILWGNQSTPGTLEESQIDFIVPGLRGSTLDINYCCIEGWTGDLLGTDNNGDDPAFVDPEANYHLTTASSCLNTGDPEFDSGGRRDRHRRRTAFAERPRRTRRRRARF